MRVAGFGGLSQGGLVALQVAPLAPDRVRGLVRSDARAGLEDVEVIRCYHRMIDAGVTDGPKDELAELFWKACPPSGLPALRQLGKNQADDMQRWIHVITGVK